MLCHHTRVFELYYGQWKIEVGWIVYGGQICISIPMITAVDTVPRGVTTQCMCFVCFTPFNNKYRLTSVRLARPVIPVLPTNIKCHRILDTRHSRSWLETETLTEVFKWSNYELVFAKIPKVDPRAELSDVLHYLQDTDSLQTGHRKGHPDPYTASGCVRWLYVGKVQSSRRLNRTEYFRSVPFLKSWKDHSLPQNGEVRFWSFVCLSLWLKLPLRAMSYQPSECSRLYQLVLSCI